MKSSIKRLSQITKMVVKHHVKGYEEFTKLVQNLEGSGENIHVLFSGGKGEDGKSWCPYCVKGKKWYIIIDNP
jgi:hypothetical protein